MDKLSLKYRIALAGVTIMLVCCMFLGSSYALWKLTNTQTAENSFQTGCFNITFTNGSGSNSISLNKAYPMSDTNGLKTTPYTFTITNACTIKASYKLLLNVLTVAADSGASNNATAAPENKKTAGQIADNLVKYNLVKGTTTNTTASLVSSLTQNTDTAGLSYGGKTLSKSYILDGGTAGITLNAKASQTYTLRLWISNSADTSINYKKFEAQLAVKATAVND